MSSPFGADENWSKSSGVAVVPFPFVEQGLTLGDPVVYKKSAKRKVLHQVGDPGF